MSERRIVLGGPWKDRFDPSAFVDRTDLALPKDHFAADASKIDARAVDDLFDSR